jgi:putative protease
MALPRSKLISVPQPLSPAAPAARVRRPEILAPAGDREALEAAVAAGADAVYFGLESWNARARATNFTQAGLGETMAFLHRGGCKGYVALNTLVFDRELPAVEAAIRACAAAEVDAIIVQDLGVARLAQAVAPQLALHASTQMTCTDAGAVELARSLGARRVVLARELSLKDIAEIAGSSDVELEVFVHGALCISYSGQCLTSEAIGGRSANRGACAQSCRLPYDLIVDGERRDRGDRAYLLSPEDLEAADLVPQLVALGVRSLKIEGRLKGPDYVAATTRLYREAVDAAVDQAPPPTEDVRQLALQMYTRGSGPGFLGGIDHQRLVEGRGCEHRGLPVGEFRGLRRFRGAPHLVVALDADLARGDGIVVEGGREGAGEIGGRVWRITVRGSEVDGASAGQEAGLWLGPDVVIPSAAESRLQGHRVFRTSDPSAERRVRAGLAAAAARALEVTIDVTVTGDVGTPARLVAVTHEPTPRQAAVSTDVAIALASMPGAALTLATARAQLGRLGGTGFVLGQLNLALPSEGGLPLSSLNRARRALVAELGAPCRPLPRAAPPAAADVTLVDLLAAATPPARPVPAPGLFVLCRNVVQARAAVAAGADGVYLDILELTGTGDAFRELAAAGVKFVGLAPPRVRKPGEEKIDRFLSNLAPHAVLVRSLGALFDLADAKTEPSRACTYVGDFSLNVSNRLTAVEVLARGADVFTPSFDLDGAQLRNLLEGALAPFAEVVVHHPMPLFHMEHCLIAAELSAGHDHLTCGRPCERHQVALRDRAGHEHPVEADVGCRNTVFHGAAQSGADLLPALQRLGVQRFRIELLRESAADVARLVGAYRALIEGRATAPATWRELRTEAGYGVVRGSLRVLDS